MKIGFRPNDIRDHLEHVFGIVLHVEHKGNETMITEDYKGKTVVFVNETLEELTAQRERDAQLRDQFAMAALTGVVSRDVDDCMSWESMATYAWRMADAMMKERARVT